MTLSGLKTNTEFLPSIHFNAREGVFSRVDRSLDAEGKWANELININELHTAWERDAENVDTVEREGGEIVPLAKVAIDSFKTKNGTFKKPIFEITRWFPRPVEWSIPVPVAAAPAAPLMAEAAIGGSFVEAPASPAGDDDLAF
jgi:hypothetical protein